MKSDPSIADTFGAKINLSMPDRGMYLVMGRTESPAALVTHVGGQVVFPIPNSLSLLAIMPVTAYFRLRTDRDIAHVGPVTIDSRRFNHFLELVGLNHIEEVPSNENQ